MAIPYGLRKVKVFENVPANTLVQVDDFFGQGGYGYLQVTNVNLTDTLKFTVNIGTGSDPIGKSIPIPMNDVPTDIPMVVLNFMATDVVTVVAYGN
jgi:hypothetical protein